MTRANQEKINRLVADAREKMTAHGFTPSFQSDMIAAYKAKLMNEHAGIGQRQRRRLSA